MKLNWKKISRVAKSVAIVAAVFVVGGLGGVYFERYALPRVRTNPVLSRVEFLKKTAENITVINRTEQVTVKEDDSVGQLAAQSSTAVVSVVSVPEVTAQKAKLRQAAPKGLTASGVIGTSDGLIVTYRTAILEKSAKYSVILNDDSVHEAKLAGVDEFTNLAFLKIDASNLPVISFASSDSAIPGKKLLAVSGSAGYAAGILSSKDKTFNLGAMALSSSEKMEGVLRTDFSQDEKYVGGPAMSYGGEMVGLNAMAMADGKPVFFLVPSEAVKESLESAAGGKLAQRPFFGAYYVPLTKEYALMRGLEREKGALIFSPSGRQSLALIAGSPAEKAGLRINDIVAKVNGEEIDVDKPLSNLLSRLRKGDKAELTLIRDGQEILLEVQL